MQNRPITTLFMLMSVDGKISTGDTDIMDFDKDLKRISGIKEGLHQYYDLERQTDFVSLNTGRVMAKIGVNTRTVEPQKVSVNFVIIDNQPHLTRSGVEYLSKWVEKLYLVTTNPDHPAIKMSLPNVVILHRPTPLNLTDLFTELKSKFKIERITIQSGGTLNAELVQQNLIDHLSLVVAPCLIGGKTTPTLIDGESLHAQEELRRIKALDLKQADVLTDGYFHLRYNVLQETVVEDTAN